MHIAARTLLGACALAFGGLAHAQLANADKISLLSFINGVRANVSPPAQVMPALVWNETLATPRTGARTGPRS